jgi:hypothetical protein
VTQKSIRKEEVLTSGKIVEFVPTGDYDKARAFYENQLGFEFVSLDQYALVIATPFSEEASYQLHSWKSFVYSLSELC